MCIWSSFEFKFGVILQMTLQPTSFKWNCTHIATMNITLQQWSCECTLYFMLILCLPCLSNRSGAGTGGHPLRWRHCCVNPLGKASNPPLIMSIKNHFPLSLAYELSRMITLLSILPHSWTHPMHDLSSCHSSKQTTILADIGVDWYHVAPATIKAYCMLRVYIEVTLICESGW